jgi:hypothetical protein
MTRFASLGSSGAASYAAAGKAAAGSAARMFDVQRKTGPDYAGLSKVAMASQTAENIAATQAEVTAGKAAINATATAQIGKIRGEYAVKKGEFDNKRRMAGILPAVGEIVGSAFKKDPKRPPPLLNVEPVKPEKVEYPTGSGERPTAPDPPTLLPIPSSVTPSQGEGSNAGSFSNGIPRTADTPTGARISQVQMKQLLMSQGMDEENATIGAAVGMAESGGDPGIRSHPDLEARTGERSLGLWQHNANTGEDRHAFYGIKDWSELKDPQTNARATYRLWKRRGSWDDWGAYTDGAYTKYLK